MTTGAPLQLNSTLGKLAAGEDLSREEMTAAIDLIMQGRATEGEIGLLLVGLRLKGESVDEVAGAAEALRRHMTRIEHHHPVLLDTCGTGGDGSQTFNISTAAALVTAAAGVPVAKHGNRAASSRSGSADVLVELGVDIECDVARVEACLDELGICFCYARLFHPSMKHVAAVRRKLGMPTVFNLLGPLCNPAGARFQLLGAGKPEWRRKLAEALALLKTERAVVVHGEDGLGEVSLAGRTQITVVEDGTLRDLAWEPEEFGLERSAGDELRVENPAQSAQVIRRVLSGEPGAARDVVVLNAAAGLWTAGRSADLGECVRLACGAVDSGAARELLARLAEKSHA